MSATKRITIKPFPMSFSFRKSVHFGPFRMNFSKSGVSYSAGIKGARINTGSRGTYVNLGSHGVYYRKKIGTQLPDPVITIPIAEKDIAISHEITSGAIDELSDTDSKPFIDELQSKSRKISYFRWFGLLPLMLTVISYFRYFAQETGGADFQTRFQTQGNFAMILFILCVALFTVWLRYLRQEDRRRLTVEIDYDMDQKMQEVHTEFLKHFSELGESRKIWQYLDVNANSDLKRSGGAGSLVRRVPLLNINNDKKPFRFLQTNVRIPNLSLRNTELYFFPERLIIKRGSKFASVFYNHLKAESDTTRFIEDGIVPRDAQIVDQTWKFVNKNGGPDRRFKNNRQIPICKYSVYIIGSATGIKEVISTSKTGAGDNFFAFLKSIGNLQDKYSSLKSPVAESLPAGV